ncbi:acyl-CoA dehydrogenase family protein [Novosphingobium sp. M1R2S20]|uniref:Acyl-CoA dehydrogenase family protein n=1 Tax=Novosphingobium rhizovicinum TaxID=3228928 RepID=A0ABV3RCC7_9SPHN
MIDFRVEPKFQEKLKWMDTFVREECELVDLLFPRAVDMYDVKNSKARDIIRPLQEKVKAQGLWACHLGPHLGGPGYGQVKLALMNEIIGRSNWAPTIFGTQAPDTGNAEILALFGTEEQKRRYLDPLMAGEIVSCFSMTEPQAGADPKEFECKAWAEGDEWVIEGEKWFSSNARFAEFLIVMAVTNPENKPHERMSMFLVPGDAPGIEIIRNSKIMSDSPDPDDDSGAHAYIRYNKVRVPKDAMLGEPGQAFKVAQARLGGGRIHHAMRTVGMCGRAIEMMLERAVSRQTQGKRFADHQFVQGMIGDSICELEQFRLLVLKTAWLIDESEAGREEHGAARPWIGMCKVTLAKVFHDIVHRAVHLHGSLGASLETPLYKMWAGIPSLSVADGPTEVHKIQVAKHFLKKAIPGDRLFGTDHIPTRLEKAKRHFAAELVNA